MAELKTRPQGGANEVKAFLAAIPDAKRRADAEAVCKLMRAATGKQALTLYIMAGFTRYGALLAKLGKYKTGKSCLYVNALADVDLTVLRELVRVSAAHVAALQGCEHDG